MNKDVQFQAKLHGFKTKAPVERVRWTKNEDEKFKNLAMKRYEEMKASE